MGVGGAGGHSTICTCTCISRNGYKGQWYVCRRVHVYLQYAPVEDGYFPIATNNLFQKFSAGMDPD